MGRAPTPMEASMSRRFRTCLILLPALALALLAGCSRGPEGAPATDPTTAPSAHEPVFLAPTPTRFAEPQCAASSTKFVSAANGGQITLGSVSVSFPKGSLPSNTLVTVSALSDGVVGFRVDPANVVLLQPVLIQVEHLEKTAVGKLRDPQAFVCQGSSATLLTTRRSGNKMECDAPALGEFRIGSAELDSADIQWLYYLDGPGYSTELIEASKGGAVEFGRFKVTLPAGALSSDTYITVRDPGGYIVQCELEPHGTQFLAPVELQVDLRGLFYLPFTDWSIYYHTDAGVWQDQGGSFNNGKVTANLWHFSDYAPARGRAGW
jgi:hypothetical protein